MNCLWIRIVLKIISLICRAYSFENPGKKCLKKRLEERLTLRAGLQYEAGSARQL